nr:hypothetical protein BaRGS_003873 [Batillaria attramentaria]
MLTPRFELSQDDDFLILVIYAPFAKVSDTEFYIEGEEIRFYSKPYYLRLHLSKPVVEDHRTEAKYDVDKGCFTAKIAKLRSGEVFEGLDMLTKLLTPPGETSAAAPGVEIADQSCGEEAALGTDERISTGTACSGEGNEDEEDETEWYIEQEMPSDGENLLTGGAKYGFACQRSGVFTKLMSEFSEILDVQDPDKLTAKEKREQRLAHEAEHFSEDHYLADLYENEEVASMLTFEPWWVGSEKCELSDEEKDQLLKLPRKHDPRYIFNDLYITDYCVWIQSADTKRLKSLAEKMAETKLSKSDVGFELEELESAAELVLKEQTDAVP